MIASTYKQCQVFDIVSLMKTLQIIKSYSYDIMGIFEESEMNDRKFITIIALAQQMPRPVNEINWPNWNLVQSLIIITNDSPVSCDIKEWNGCMIFGHAFDDDIHLKCFVKLFVIMIISLHPADKPQLLGVCCKQWCVQHKWPSGHDTLIICTGRICNQCLCTDRCRCCDGWSLNKKNTWNCWTTFG